MHLCQWVIHCNHTSKISFTSIKLLQLLPLPELLEPICVDVMLTMTLRGLIIVSSLLGAKMSITQSQSRILLTNVMIRLIRSIVEHEASSLQDPT